MGTLAAREIFSDMWVHYNHKVKTKRVFLNALVKGKSKFGTFSVDTYLLKEQAYVGHLNCGSLKLSDVGMTYFYLILKKAQNLF